MSNSPLSHEETEWDEDAVMDLCVFRVNATDEEWANDIHDEWNISREEAARRIRENDFSVPARFLA